MAPKFHIFLLLLSLSFVPGQFHDITVGRKVLVGQWLPIKNPKEAIVQEIGKFAVTTYNQDNQQKLVYQNVTRGQTQVVAGTNYRLTIAAKDNGTANHYEAIVFDQPWTHTRNLTSFKPQ
ncbi:Cysteine proteinase inhibitor 5 [Heracleum sosnowskyi]|uniref:Cysteine proteinase inhibitor 5 n=1 Tax=Heracleum sosnowskyi TaxID=360622 RepID=A0AAD8J3X0_9APIA|nr:Cysteine proteinase inhibitor 5 [Heracleum sosnowskyi]